MCKQKPVANIPKVAIIRLKILNDTNYFGAIYTDIVGILRLSSVTNY